MSEIFFDVRNNCKLQVNVSKLQRNRTKIGCDVTWDGIMCWPFTPVGHEAELPCPEYFGFNPKNVASKKCMDDGEWFVHDNLNTTWTNYSQCTRLYDYETAMMTIAPHAENLTFIQWWFPKIKIVRQIGYGISLSALILAIIIFCSFRKLRCARNRLHMHLFLSFSLKASMSLLKDLILVDGTVMALDMVQHGKNTYVKEHNFWICKAITSLWQYCIMTNYILILMEGIYLHNLLFLTLFSDRNEIKLYTAMGWGLPLCFILPWIVLKITYDDELCWTTHKYRYYQLLIHVPIVISTLINFILFMKIVHILLVKLNSIYIQQRKIKYRRLIRSTMILMPLFGVPYTFSIMTWYYASTDQMIELIWLMFDQTFTSFQGFFVAFLYCLLNNDVQNELKRKFLSYWNGVSQNEMNRHYSFPMYGLSRSNGTTCTIFNGNERRLTN